MTQFVQLFLFQFQKGSINTIKDDEDKRLFEEKFQFQKGSINT